LQSPEAFLEAIGDFLAAPKVSVKAERSG
jgi:hypothetical protein